MHDWGPWIAAIGAVVSAGIAATVAWLSVRAQRPKLEADAADAISAAADRVVRMTLEQHRRCEEQLVRVHAELDNEREARRRDVARLAETIEAGDGGTG